MDDLKERFSRADELEVPELWAEIQRIEPGGPPPVKQLPRHRLLVAALAILVAAVPIGFVIRDLRPSEGPGAEPTKPSASPVPRIWLEARPVLSIVTRGSTGFRRTPLTCPNKATLESCWANVPESSDVALAVGMGKFLLGPAIFDASNVVSASAVQALGGTDWGVRLVLDPTGASRLAELSGQGPQSQIANVIDGHFISANPPQGRIDGVWFIFSDLTQPKAQELATRLGAGVTSATPVGVGTISGRLVAVGGPTNAERPLPGTVRVIGKQRVVFRVLKVGPDGAFSVSVPPGTYELAGSSPLYQSGHRACHSGPIAVVTEGSTVSADVICQEK